MTISNIAGRQVESHILPNAFIAVMSPISSNHIAGCNGGNLELPPQAVRSMSHSSMR